MVIEAPPETFIRTEKPNKIGVRVFKGGIPVTLNGTVEASVLMPDGTTVSVLQNGSISRNEASVVLTDQCYSMDGKIQVALALVSSGERTTLGVCRGTVYDTRI